MLRDSLRPFLLATLLFGAALPPLAFAGSYRLTYGGQALDANGNPLTSQINFSVNFYRAASGGLPLLGTAVFATAVPDATGVYNIDLPIADSDMQTVFPGPGTDAWIEADIVTGGVTTAQPRQRYSAVPYALKVPVDGTTLSYGASGLLSLQTVPTSLLSGTLQPAQLSGVSLPAAQLSGTLPAGVTIPAASLLSGTAGISISGNAATATAATAATTATTASGLTTAGWASPGPIGASAASSGVFTSLSASSLSGGGAGLTGLTAANITPGGTLPALNGAALTSLTPSALSSGTAGINISGNAATATTAASASSATTATTADNVSGTVAVGNGGTGATTAATALANLLPSQTGASGKVLASNGTTASWAASSLSIGGAVASGTSGSVLFVDGTGNLGQSSSKFSWDNTNARLGLGISAPSEALDVSGAVRVGSLGANGNPFGYNGGAAGNQVLQVYTQNSLGATVNIYGAVAGSASWETGLGFSRSNGTAGAETALQSGDSIAGILFRGSTAANTWTSSARLDAIPTANWSAVSAPTALTFATTAANSLNPVERLRIDSTGNVGIGTTSPSSALVVSGAARNSGAISNSTSTIDFATGNLQYTASSCGAFILNNLKDGGSYTFTVKGTIAATCSFTAYSDGGVTALTVHMPPGHTATTAAKHTMYVFLTVGADLYVSWTPGY